MLSAVILNKILYICLVTQDLDYDRKWNLLWQSEGPVVYLVAERQDSKFDGEFKCDYRRVSATCEESWSWGDTITRGYHCVGSVQ